MTKKTYLWLAVALVVMVLAVFGAVKFFRHNPGSLSALIKKSPPTLVSSVASEPSGEPAGTFESFSDGFSGQGHIDLNQTDLYLDYNVTAFSFPPVYDLKKMTTPLVSSTPAISPANSKLCLGGGANALCLSRQANKLYLNNKVLAWPPELAQENILQVTAQLLSNARENRWIVGVVTGQAHDEQGWVYFFNGRDFSPVITATTTLQIKPLYDHLGGRIYFGGDLDDFLILYSAYDGRAFYYHNGSLSDVSRFFSLRVADGGFPAQILRTTNKRGSVFYICSQGTPKFKLLKLWSRQPGELIGALDFSYLLSGEGAPTVGCSFDTGGSLQLGFKATSSVATTSSAVATSSAATSSEAWLFTDYGFDDSQARQVTSKDIWEVPGQDVLAAEFNRLSVYTDGMASSWSSATTTVVTTTTAVTPAAAPKYQLFLANQPNNWQEALPNNWYRFSQPTTSLYWRAVFPAEPGDSDYSPWFDSLNELLFKALK
jgi:hypothetical protein